MQINPRILGSTITIEFTASETIEIDSVLLNGVSLTSSYAASVYSASLVVGSTTIEGIASFSISFHDTLGNTGHVNETKDGSFVLIGLNI